MFLNLSFWSRHFLCPLCFALEMEEIGGGRVCKAVFKVAISHSSVFTQRGQDCRWSRKHSKHWEGHAGKRPQVGFKPLQDQLHGTLSPIFLLCVQPIPAGMTQTWFHSVCPLCLLFCLALWEKRESGEVEHPVQPDEKELWSRQASYSFPFPLPDFFCNVLFSTASSPMSVILTPLFFFTFTNQTW